VLTLITLDKPVGSDVKVERKAIGESIAEPVHRSEATERDSPFRLLRRDLIALQALLMAFAFMAVMNFWNLLSALFR
jgi:hypothetical protein